MPPRLRDDFLCDCDEGVPAAPSSRSMVMIPPHQHKKSPRRKQKVHVRFSNTVRVKRIPNCEDMTKEEKKELYLSKEEIQSIRNGILFLIAAAAAAAAAAGEQSNNTEERDGIATRTSNDQHCAGCQEESEYSVLMSLDRLTKEQALQRKQRIRYAVECVVIGQQQQRTGFDDELIAHMYSRCCTHSSELAQERGLQFQRELEMICDMAPVASRVMERC
jgi:hypothetical protein